MDAGGLTREWYQVLSRELFRPQYGLFLQSPDGVTFSPNPQSELAAGTAHLSYFRFIGQLLGKAVCDAQVLDVHFTRALYKHIVGQPVSYEDLEAADLDFFKNMKYLLQCPMADLGVELTFSCEVTGLGETSKVDLVPGGAGIEVTDENKGEYVRLIAHHRMTASIRRQVDAFLDGFHQLVPSELVSFLEASELELLISGLPDIDIDDMEAHTTYSGYTRNDPTIRALWSVLRRFSREEKALFVQFVTGTSKVPLDGFAALQGNGGVQCMSVTRTYDTSLLPAAHTCFNQLDLPDYAVAGGGGEDGLREKLLISIREGSIGFGFG